MRVFFFSGGEGGGSRVSGIFFTKNPNLKKKGRLEELNFFYKESKSKKKIGGGRSGAKEVGWEARVSDFFFY